MSPFNTAYPPIFSLTLRVRRYHKEFDDFITNLTKRISDRSSIAPHKKGDIYPKRFAEAIYKKYTGRREISQ